MITIAILSLFYFAASDMWCMNRKTGGYPSDLLPSVPLEKTGISPITPPPPVEGGSNGGNSGGSTGSNAKMVFPTVGLIIMALLFSLIK